MNPTHHWALQTRFASRVAAVLVTAAALVAVGLTLPPLAAHADPASVCTSPTPTDAARATGVTAKASSGNAALAIDGSTTTRWESASSDPQWIQVDLGSSQGVCQIHINWETAASAAFVISTSEDGNSWTDATGTLTAPAGASPIPQTINFPSVVSARFVKLTSTARKTQYGNSIWDLNIYSNGADGNDVPLYVPPCVAGTPTDVPDAPDFGPNVTIFNPGESPAAINQKLLTLSDTTEFDTRRQAVFFLPGTYGCANGTDLTSTVNGSIGYYTSVAGLGASPDDVTINGALHVEPEQVSNDPWNTQQPGSLDIFWRSLSNVKVNPIQLPVGVDATRANPEGIADPGTMRWAVSQAAPLRRVDIAGNLSLFGRFGAASSGGFMADSKVSGQVIPGSQQQFYTRDSSIGSTSGGVWNMVYSGVQGGPAQNFPTTGNQPTGGAPTTSLATTPESQDTPFLYVDGDAYKVFVPKARTDASGTDWSTDASNGRSLSIDSFYIAHDTDTAETINAQLDAGKNLILTPGIYQLDEALNVTHDDTVVLGLGYATLEPTAGNAVIKTGDVKGVSISGVSVDAGEPTSHVLIQVGPQGAQSGESDDPTALHDVFIRIGGPHEGSVDTAIQVNSDDVILDDIWSWRADHGTGVGWDDNTGKTGLEVNGDNVTALGLFVEHYQQNQVIWNGDDGTTVFYQSELPYDVPSQDAWNDGSREGYASYKVADDVTTHTAYGLGVYSFFNQNVDINETSAIQAPRKPGVTFTDAVTRFLNGSGGISHVINDVGDSVALGSAQSDMTAYVDSYPPAGTQAVTVGIAATPSAPNASGWYPATTLAVSATGDADAQLWASVDGGDPVAVTDGSFTVPDGDHTVVVTATDAGGAFEANASWSGKVDATAPAAEADVNGHTVTLSASDAGSGIDSVEYAVGSQEATDGSDWTSYGEPFHAHAGDVVSYRAIDKAGNSSAIASVTIPSVTVGLAADPAAPESSGWYTSTPNLTVSTTGDDDAELWASVDGGDAVRVDGPIAVPDGQHTVTVTAKDAVDGTSEAQASWTGKVDTVAPQVDASESHHKVTLTGTDATSGIDHVEYSIGSAVATGASEWSTYAQPVAAHVGQVVSYRATDAAGNVSAIASLSIGDVSLHVTSTPPTAGSSGWYTSATTLAVEVVGDDSATVTASVDGGDAVAVDGAFTVPQGDHTVTITVTDANGAVDATATWQGKVDTVAPVATGSVSGHTLTVTATDATSGVDRIEYSLDGSSWTAYTAPITVGGGQSVSYRAFDVAGNVSSTGTQSLALDTLATGKPVITGTAAVGSTLKATAGRGWTSGAKLSYQWYANGKAIKGATKTSLKLAVAQGGTRITVGVTGTKAGFTTGKATSKQTAVVLKKLVTATPKISGTARVGVTLHAKTGKWTTGTKFSYQWYASGKKVTGAVKATLKLSSSTAGKKITVVVTGKHSGYTSAKISSKPTKAVRR